MPDAIPPLIVAELRARLRAQVADPTLPDAELGRALRELGAFARSHGVQVEQLLVLLKDTFDRLTPHSGLTVASATDRTERLEKLVTLCIRAYYS
ncbi:MAG TPA: hypothetical protein VNW46_15485 [Gemmatimonadaceae bacterium]|jgi:hypothetical protein|nr:hypothetical protein [Gemmatimonadaceae bacterium]